MWRRKPGQQKEIECTRPHACLVHTIKKSSSTTKKPCSSPPKFLVTYGADNNKSSVYTLETWWCWRPKDILLACLRAKISRRRTCYLARKRVGQNDQKVGFAEWENLDRELKRRCRCHPIFSWCTRRIEKNEASARGKFSSVCSSVEDSLLECLRANISRRSSTFDFVSKPRSGKDLHFTFFSLFITVLITNNGRLDQRAWFKNDILEDFLEVVSTCLLYTSPSPRD